MKNRSETNLKGKKNKKLTIFIKIFLIIIATFSLFEEGGRGGTHVQTVYRSNSPTANCHEAQENGNTKGLHLFCG